MDLQLDADELYSLQKGLEASRTPLPNELDWDPAATSVAPASGEAFVRLAGELPERASWAPEDRAPDLLSRDGLLLTAVLSCWKVLRLIEGFRTSWGSGPQGFNGMTAAVVLRAAMEESARLALAGRRVRGLLEAWPQSAPATLPSEIVEFAELLLEFGETTGLEIGSGRWKALQAVKDAAPDGPLYRGGAPAADYLYGRLSTYVHPKGVSRSLFRNTQFVGAEGLVQRPSKNQSLSLMLECVAAYVYVADTLQTGWRAVAAAVSEIDERIIDLRDRAPALLCFTDSTMSRAADMGMRNIEPTIERRGIWTFWEVPAEA